MAAAHGPYSKAYFRGWNAKRNHNANATLSA
eukprot:CAMPEP_0178437740 /NCGR_PEP_ID=MMETSP0689_2-20121128/35173_1 /TAXON_ID=160604 /ORGANISM="Amphidinium massartii, Strain CS-259" /LENGTH=30 /DNA_ID= /DNA_START= /DNA_END= /DNA_ORIENTATION=